MPNAVDNFAHPLRRAMLLEGFFSLSTSKYSFGVDNVTTKKCCLCLAIGMHERMEDDEGVVCVFPCCDKVVVADGGISSSSGPKASVASPAARRK